MHNSRSACRRNCQLEQQLEKLASQATIAEQSRRQAEAASTKSAMVQQKLQANLDALRLQMSTLEAALKSVTKQQQVSAGDIYLHYRPLTCRLTVFAAYFHCAPACSGVVKVGTRVQCSSKNLAQRSERPCRMSLVSRCGMASYGIGFVQMVIIRVNYLCRMTIKLLSS